MENLCTYKVTGNFIEALSPLCDTGLMYKITCGKAFWPQTAKVNGSVEN